MSPGGRKTDQLRIIKDGRVDNHVVQVLTTGSCVIGHDHVTFLKPIGAMNCDTIANGSIQVTHKKRQSTRCLGDQFARCVQ